MEDILPSAIQHAGFAELDNGLPAGASPAQEALHQSDGENKFQRAIAAWRKIDLGTLIPNLDSTASDIISHQRDSLVQRKDLAQKTKDFKKLDDAAKVGEFKGLLKAYQTFIDLLTIHSKATSSGFLQLYSSLSEAPDPYPLLEASVESLLISEETLPKITSENEHLQITVANLSSQLEATEKHLEEERKARRALEDSQDSKIKEIESSWAAVAEEKRDNWEAKERSLEEKLESQDRLLKELKASYEVSQRLGRAEDNNMQESLGVVSAAELEVVNSELERTSMRLAEIEARNEQLRLQLAQSASHAQQAHTAHSAEDDPASLRLKTENSSLLRKLDAAKLDKTRELRSWEGKVSVLEREVATLKGDRDSLKAKLHMWGDYEDVKRELDMLKSIEFATGDDEEGESLGVETSTSGQPNQELDETGRGKGQSLEQLLLARNKKLGNELTILRISHRDLQSRVERLLDELSSANAELEKSQRLNSTLENDLEKLQREASNALPSSAMSVVGTYTSRHPQSSNAYANSSFAGRRGRSSPTSSIISGFDPQSTLEAIRAGEPIGGGSGILPMITAQRDRFKQRNSQLEDELSKSHNAIASLRQEIASLQKDNLNLYEKTRYISTYSRGGPSHSSSSAYASNGNPSTIQISPNTSSGLSLDRYRSAYEANISPFAAFRGRESVRAYKRMSLPERIVFSITRMVLANRVSRNLFAGYCLALHVLVFGMLYWMGTMDIDKHASQLGQAAAGAASLASTGGLKTAVSKLGAATGAEGSAHHGDWHQGGFSSSSGAS
ncbi:MAG: hypothetical protein M1829_005335 [Trizodia sp. TS-e1964]|nr:MAG: hypothetical protein M1829_005335 [Trizodia sp. TS-e1964]